MFSFISMMRPYSRLIYKAQVTFLVYTANLGAGGMDCLGVSL